jgi:ankyrin repeat protein
MAHATNYIEAIHEAIVLDIAFPRQEGPSHYNQILMDNDAITSPVEKALRRLDVTQFLNLIRENKQLLMITVHNDRLPFHIFCQLATLEQMNEFKSIVGDSIKTCNVFGASRTENSSWDDLLSELVNKQEDTQDGMYPIHYACVHRNIPIIEFLLENGADINAKTKEGHEMTALHLAAQKDLKGVFTFLLSNGADTTISSIKGYTIAHMAALMGNSDLIPVLIQYNVDMLKKNADGFTPFKIALYHNQQEFIQEMVVKGVAIHPDDKAFVIQHNLRGYIALFNQYGV